MMNDESKTGVPLSSIHHSSFIILRRGVAPMHVMFIHPNFPAQFGHIAYYLKTQLGWDATCVTSIDTSHLNLPFTHLNYKVYEGPQPTVFYNPNDLQTL